VTRRVYRARMASSDLHKRCLDCRYILDGLPEARCPECGRAFDPEDPDTYVAPEQRSAWSPIAKLILAVAVVHLLVLSVSTYDVGLRIPGEWYPLGGCDLDWVGLTAALTSPIVLIACACTRRRPAIWISVADLLFALVWAASIVRLLSYL
jgi:hypothetical protein